MTIHIVVSASHNVMNSFEILRGPLKSSFFHCLQSHIFAFTEHFPRLMVLMFCTSGCMHLRYYFIDQPEVLEISDTYRFYSSYDLSILIEDP